MAATKKSGLTAEGRQVLEGYGEELARLRSLPRVIKTKDVPIVGKSHCYLQYLVTRERGQFPNVGEEEWPIRTMISFIEYMAPGARSQKHGHQNEAMLYVLEGRGYDIHDGQRIDWEAGDLVIVPAGSVHQHFNLDQDKPAKVLALNPKPLYIYMGFQQEREVERPSGE